MAIGSFKLPTGGGGTSIADADAAVGDVLSGKTFYSGSLPKKTGTMVNRGEVDTDITTKDQVVTIAAGYHNGDGTVQISAAEQAKVIAGNIKSGVTLLGQAGSLTGATDYVLREYTGSDTWTKPTGLKELFVVCIGGGAGGGSGSRGATNTLRRGGGGGGGTVIVWRKISAAELGSTETITIGGGGSGGAAVTEDDTNGNNGTAGGDTSFGSLVVSKGGNAGKAGINGSNTDNSSFQIADNQCTPIHNFYTFILGGGMGSSVNGSNGGSSSVVLFYQFQYGSNYGGAGGGGKSTSNTTGNGGSGSRLYKINHIQSLQIPGGTANNPGNSGLDNQGLQLLMQYNTTAIPTKGLGTSGAGGGAGDNTPTAAGAGGNGGSYGGSGGGGGASLNGANSGKGGDGADGLCLVYEQY